jgi:Zn-dependent protease with chaperone function
MRRRFTIAQIFLWLFVITLGITLGGGLYETLVVMPLWAAAPPESVIAYYRHNVANPQLTLDQGGRFWIFVTPLLGLLCIAVLLSGLRTRPEHRLWRSVAAALALLVVVFTFAWFVPNIVKLMGEGVTTMTPEQITSLTNWWSRLNWLRAFLYFVAWLAALRALSISPKPERLYN